MARAALLALAVVAASVVSDAARAQTPPVDSARSVVEGTVTGRFGGVTGPLPYALVEAIGERLRRTVLADSLGRYTISGLPAGQLRLRATHAGHAALSVEVLVAAGASVRVDLELLGQPVELESVEVVGDRRGLDVADPSGRNVETEPRPLPEVEIQALDVAPGVAQAGLLDAVQSLPGNDPAQATDVLFMRGATTDMKLVLLDGAPVYTPFHVAGLLRSFEPAVLGRAELHVGGAPARYDGGLTHILDLETRRPRRDRLRGSGSVDLLSATVALEGPVGGLGGFVASARSLHDFGRAPLGGPRPYGYRDALLSAEIAPAAEHRLRGTVFWNSESVLLDFPSAPDDASWSNGALSIGWAGRLGAARVDVTAAASGYRATLPLQPTGRRGEPPPPALLASAETDRARVVAEVAWGGADAPTRTGVSFDRIDATYQARSLSGGAPSGGHARTATGGVYVDATRPLAPGLSFRGGLRADVFDGASVRLAPRGALLWEVGPEALVTVAVGRYHQPTRTPDVEVERTLAEVVDDSTTTAELLPVATADHVVLSLDQLLGRTVRLGLQGFWKRYDGLASAPVETIRSSGIDLRLLSAGARGTVWLGYGLSWFWSTRDLSGYSSDFAGRHLLSAGLSGGLGGPLRGELRVAYGAGIPYTAIPFRASGEDLAANPDGPGVQNAQDSPLLGGLDEEFLRVDLEVQALFEPAWLGGGMKVRPYLRVLNALDRRDALFYTFQPWRDASLRPLAERPLLPILGVAVSF